MLITITFANKRLANHYDNIDAIYVSSLDFSFLATKKGIASDRATFSMPIEALNDIFSEFAYLIYETPVIIEIDKQVLFRGYVTKIDTRANNKATFEATSVMTWQLQQFFSPSIEGTCQNQVYSQNCKLDRLDYSIEFSNVNIDCMTGYATIEILSDSVILGGDSSITLLDSKRLFLKPKNWWQAIVVINGVYRTKVVNVTEDRIYFAMNYMDLIATTSSLTVYLKCDKTYGTCYSRFNNVKNFWGFANTGRRVTTYDIFSAAALEYCGEDSVSGPLEHCTTDDNIIGVEL
jgi:hypothetical protein